VGTGLRQMGGFGKDPDLRTVVALEVFDPETQTATKAPAFSRRVPAYRTPVFLLSDGYLANGAVPWRLSDVASLPDLSDVAVFATGPNHTAPDVSPEYWPYLRDPSTHGPSAPTGPSAPSPRWLLPATPASRPTWLPSGRWCRPTSRPTRSGPAWACRGSRPPTSRRS